MPFSGALNLIKLSIFLKYLIFKMSVALKDALQRDNASLENINKLTVDIVCN
jgi:hypothetical protein